jgi:hypothetical protein
MNMTNNINPVVPTKIKAFVKAVSTVPAPNFDPFIYAENVDIQPFENCYSIVFFGLKKTVNMSLVYPWIPTGFRCSGMALMGNILTLDIQNAVIN